MTTTPGPWHALLVDDEPLARRELRHLLAAHPQVVVVGEADSVASAAQVAHLTGADLVFLDVQLRRESGLTLVSQLPPGVRVVVVTAFDAYAVRAFDLDAHDYLLKPVEPQRLAATLARLDAGRGRRAPAEEPPAAPTVVDGASDAPGTPSRWEVEERLFVRDGHGMRLIALAEITAIVADRDHVAVHLRDGRRQRVRKPIGEWEARLPAAFLRIHRSVIVRVADVVRLEPWSHGSYQVHVRGVPTPFVMSRRFASRLRARLR
ncbi:MAG: LytTR family DNA-binding domain-containing protein [Gemmatimonadaceae bacterium]|nr:LytTR family DNA-binding domain-containing protein [Gemmatimonadaceae bacterium]